MRLQSLAALPMDDNTPDHTIFTIPRLRLASHKKTLQQLGNSKGAGTNFRHPPFARFEPVTAEKLSPPPPLEIEVRPEGLEPPTPGSEDQCSIQLSYGRRRGVSSIDP